tara:strand:- start:9691 stop:10110 length:420 start_codon:yes stop_codon:yes gene_type:complete
MDSVSPNLRRSRNTGVALLEAMLALAVFGLVTVSLVGALRSMSLLTIESAQEAHAVQAMRTLMEQQLHSQEVEPGVTRIGPDELGVSYQVNINPEVSIIDGNGIALPDLYQIEVIAAWKEGDRTQSRRAETLKNALLYP